METDHPIITSLKRRLIQLAADIEIGRYERAVSGLYGILLESHPKDKVREEYIELKKRLTTCLTNPRSLNKDEATEFHLCLFRFIEESGYFLNQTYSEILPQMRTHDQGEGSP